MGIHQNLPALKATAHLLDSAGYYTKDANSDPLDVLAKKFGDFVSETMTKLGATNNQLASVKEQIAEIEQKAMRAGGSYEPSEHETLGKQFVESDRFKTFIANGGQHSRNARVDLTVKANLTSLTTDAAGSVGSAAVPSYRDAITLLPQRRLVVRDLLPVIRVESGSVEAPVQKGRTNAAAMVAEGGAKPKSDIQFEMKQFPTRVIAHHMKASRQILDDAPQLRGVIDAELMYGLKLKEEAQLLLGDNTGQNLNGMIPQATAYTGAGMTVADLNIIDIIGIAALQAALADYAADGVIIHSADWLTMRIMKDTEGRYIFGPPSSPVEPRLFGLPIVPTPAMTSRKFLVGQFQVAGTIYDRWEARVELGYENDDFTTNMVTILGEERLALGVKLPGALIYGDFDTALAA